MIYYCKCYKCSRWEFFAIPDAWKNTAKNPSTTLPLTNFKIGRHSRACVNLNAICKPYQGILSTTWFSVRLGMRVPQSTPRISVDETATHKICDYLCASVVKL
jgi:hypothetical protein